MSEIIELPQPPKTYGTLAEDTTPQELVAIGRSLLAMQGPDEMALITTNDFSRYVEALARTIEL